MAKIPKTKKAQLIDAGETSQRYERHLKQPASTEMVQMLFKLDAGFRDEFARYAFDRKMTYKELLERCFTYYKEHHTD
ncbi:hypothetical protein KC799_16415 [candidate division KSB1 bacterium]|nr:hypothetical protein [candidate division KSB1 bacterium]